MCQRLSMDVMCSEREKIQKSDRRVMQLFIETNVHHKSHCVVEELVESSYIMDV